MKITEQNWTSTHYICDPLRAFISLGAIPAANEDALLLYLVTVTDKDYCEVFQSTHNTLNEALKILNEKYGHWEAMDAARKSSGDGCSSCVAH